MRRFAAMLAICAVAALGSRTASAEVLWRGTFENGDLPKWTKIEQVNPDRLEVVSDPVVPERQVLKVKVIQGDDPIKASGNRNELTFTGDMPKEGEERFYEWSTMWPEDFESADTWQLFTQWHHTGLNGSPPVELYSMGEEIHLRVNEEIVWKGPLERGSWKNFVLHVNWATDPDEGFVEMYYDGRIVLPKMYTRTMYPDQGVYLKQGLYRNAKITQQQILYHSGVTIATALDDVMPREASAEEPAGSDGSTGGAGSDQGLVIGADGQLQAADATAAAGCESAGLGVAWPAFGLGLAILAVRWRRLKLAKVALRR